MVELEALELEALEELELEEEAQVSEGSHCLKCKTWNDLCCTALQSRHSLRKLTNHPICSSSMLACHKQLQVPLQPTARASTLKVQMTVRIAANYAVWLNLNL